MGEDISCPASSSGGKTTIMKRASALSHGSRKIRFTSVRVEHETETGFTQFLSYWAEETNSLTSRLLIVHSTYPHASIFSSNSVLRRSRALLIRLESCTGLLSAGIDDLARAGLDSANCEGMAEAKLVHLKFAVKNRLIYAWRRDIAKRDFQTFCSPIVDVLRTACPLI